MWVYLTAVVHCSISMYGSCVFLPFVGAYTVGNWPYLVSHLMHYYSDSSRKPTIHNNVWTTAAATSKVSWSAHTKCARQRGHQDHMPCLGWQALGWPVDRGQAVGWCVTRCGRQAWAAQSESGCYWPPPAGRHWQNGMQICLQYPDRFRSHRS